MKLKIEIPYLINGWVGSSNNDDQIHYIDSKISRLDGPALKTQRGEMKMEYWFVDGERINCQTQAQFEKIMKMKAFW